jgi:hypothetical protein
MRSSSFVVDQTVLREQNDALREASSQACANSRIVIAESRDAQTRARATRAHSRRLAAQRYRP